MTTIQIGDKFGRLTVIDSAGYKQYHKSRDYLWKCRCECGNQKIISETSLKRGTISCGCYQRQKAKELSTKHSYHNHPLYKVWCSIKSRCYNKNCDCYERYGGRGITVCEEWKNNAGVFCEWALQNGYQQGLSIDRIDNNGNYEPNNCRWVDSIVQANNKRNNHTVIFEGNEINICELSRLTGVDHRLIISRLKRGWCIEDCVNILPVKGRNQHMPCSTQRFIEKAHIVHGDKYDYSKSEYINTDTKVCIICPEHVEFWQTPYKHINCGRGCRECALNKRRKK